MSPGAQSLRQGQGQAPRHQGCDAHNKSGGGGPDTGEQLQPHGWHPAQLSGQGAHPHTLVPETSIYTYSFACASVRNSETFSTAPLLLMFRIEKAGSS